MSFSNERASTFLRKWYKLKSTKPSGVVRGEKTKDGSVPRPGAFLHPNEKHFCVLYIKNGCVFKSQQNIPSLVNMFCLCCSRVCYHSARRYVTSFQVATTKLMSRFNGRSRWLFFTFLHCLSKRNCKRKQKLQPTKWNAPSFSFLFFSQVVQKMCRYHFICLLRQKILSFATITLFELASC